MLEKVKLTVGELREIFNRDILASIESATYYLKLVQSGNPAAGNNQRPGTLSQLHQVLDDEDRLVAVVHSYEYKGRRSPLDPKKIIKDGYIFHI